MEFPYVELLIPRGVGGLRYDQGQLVTREEFMAAVSLSDDMGNEPPTMAELTENEQMALMLALGDDALVEYAKAAQIVLPQTLATEINGEFEFAPELQQIISGFDQADVFNALLNFARTNPNELRHFAYENLHDNVDFVTTAEAVTVRPGIDTSVVVEAIEDLLMATCSR